MERIGIPGVLLSIVLSIVAITWIVHEIANTLRKKARLRLLCTFETTECFTMALAWPWSTNRGIKELIRWIRKSDEKPTKILLAALRLRDILSMTGHLTVPLEEEIDALVKTTAYSINEASWKPMHLMQFMELRNRVCAYNVRLWKAHWWKGLRESAGCAPLQEWEWEAILPHIDAIRHENDDVFTWIVSILIEGQHYEWLHETYAQRIPEDILQRLRVENERYEHQLRGDDRALDYLDVLTSLRDWDAIRDRIERTYKTDSPIRAAYVNRLYEHGQATLCPPDHVPTSS